MLVTGKGGVGKTAVSGVLGESLRRRGRRVLLLEVDPRENLHQMLEVPPSAGEILTVSDGLYLQNLPPRRVMDSIVAEQVRLEGVTRRILGSPVYRHVVEGAPGLKEVAVLGHAWRLVNGRAGRRAPAIDTVVLDAPASGHGVSLLAAPALVAEVIRQGPFARMARELAEFVADPGRCSVVVVTTAEEMPVQEAIELLALLDSTLGRSAELVVVNRLYPPFEGETVTFLDALWRQRRGENEREIERLLEHWDGPTVTLPMLAIDHGPELLASLGERLEGA